MATLRPCDGSGDVLPVLSVSDLLEGSDVTAKLIQYRLKLLAGEWWEYPEDGNQVLKTMQDSRMTEEDAAAVGSYLTSYIADTPGVFSIENAETAMEGRHPQPLPFFFVFLAFVGVNTVRAGAFS